ncbi:hypothetical protein SeMB42_g07705 [Synchytrium endobioticum]|uniref:Uncharacterized protein n=1 Tax=Synchytrium endobioticum TaxID=286115 RepID=A0A507CYG8_9FUNG|nr:hypothetical protein SeMB42_g07705 [Synchytrium endobioticum]TPX44259.1 hypothetical protein SeLEV6574_g04606 [Synchytrium endobioticum]
MKSRHFDRFAWKRLRSCALSEFCLDYTSVSEASMDNFIMGGPKLIALPRLPVSVNDGVGNPIDECDGW